MVVPEPVSALMCDQAAFDDLKRRVAVLSAFAGIQYDQFFGSDSETLVGTRTAPDLSREKVYCRLSDSGEPILAYDPKYLP